MRWLDSLTDSMDMNGANTGRSWRAEKPSVHGAAESGHALVTEQQQGKPQFGASSKKVKSESEVHSIVTLRDPV